MGTHGQNPYLEFELIVSYEVNGNIFHNTKCLYEKLINKSTATYT